MRKRIRRQTLAEMFGVHIRTIDLWVKKGILPAPHFVPGSKIPLWYDDQIEKLTEEQVA